jgi:ParB/RepB/Spo0J family partition protein
MQLKSILVAALRPSPGNRTMLGIPELAASIQRTGRMLQPPVVTDQGDGSFLIVAGHRRIAAAAVLGWKHVDCSVIETTEPDLLRAVENMAREDPLPHELCAQVAALLEKHDKKTVCRATGYSAPHIKNLERVKTHLCPEAWSVFVAQGRKARISDWFTIAGMMPARQKAVLFGDPSNPIKPSHDGPKRPRKGQVMAEYNRLPPEHPGAAWLGWVLGTREKPGWL